MGEPPPVPPIDYATPERRRLRPIIIVIVSAIALFAAIGVLLPTFNTAREPLRPRCTSNMRQIGQALLLYSNENRNVYPPDLATALATQDLVSEVFICPGSDSEKAVPHFTSDPAARIAKNLDYVYVGEGLKSDVRAEEPILFERLSNHGHDGGNVLFGDGHVEFVTKPQILKLLEPLCGTSRLSQEEYYAIVAK